MRSKLRGIAVVAALVIAASAFATAGDDDMAAKIASAKTTADHEAIAAEYTRQADEARGKAEKHDKMGKSYTGALKEKLHLDEHCKTIADGYRRTAKELDAVAAAHREQAKQSK